ncbi:MAG: PKD domain-containing protein, partial [Bacteroidetes bacterium]|nr:PKD domain-containing protein [Bacteroidota bacterium]
MNQFLSFIKSKLLCLISLPQIINRNTYLLIYGIFFFPTLIMAEGSKEIYQGTNETHLYLCSNFLTQCSSMGGLRTQFAVYECDEQDRMNFSIFSNDEIVYIGLNGSVGGGNKIVYRIKDEFGNIVAAEADFPLSGLDPGYIPSINEARVGPSQLYGALGYDAIEFSPPGPGVYYIEFQRMNSFTGLPNPGGFEIDLFDITVANTTTSTAKPGRLYSKAWQLYESNSECSAEFFIYSTDSIITSLELNNLNGGIWVTFCNQTGCGSTGDFTEDRKSVPNQQIYAPQYNVFLNEPDIDIFPPAQILGSIIPPVIGQTHCDDGTIDFLLEVDKAGNVEIELNFDPPYVTRTLITIVDVGVNTITWDGYDGTSPDSLPVPHNTNITFTVSYINGLTNLPLYDVESNNNGFVIGLVSPAGTTPLVYWDDSNIPGGSTNFAGCASTSSPWSGCHPWPDGDYHTINTWWYTSSQTTAPVIILEERVPDSLIFNQPTQNYCAGASNIPISVTIDPNTEIYYWDFTGNDVTINQNPPPNDNSITIDFGPNATTGDVFVYGYNSICGNGDTSYLFIGIQELPIANAGADDTICVNQVITLSGSRTNSNSSSWSTLGDGTFSNSTILTPIYTPGAGDIAVGSVDLILTATAIAPCADPVMDTMTLTFDPLPIANAGDNDSICINGTYTLSGSRTFSSSSLWATAGDGAFDDATSLTATYTPGPNDVLGVSVELTLNANANLPCTVADQDVMTLTFDPLPIADAGPNENICLNGTITLAGSIQNSNSSQWSTAGDGTFDDYTSLTATYTPGNTDKIVGSVTLTLTADAELHCTDADIDEMILTLDPLPQPQIGISPNDTVCINETVIFNGTDISGTNIITWEWDFGDGNTAVGQNTNYIYTVPFPTVDSVMLIAINDNSCTDTVYRDIWVMDPTIGFNISPKPACLGDTISFTGTGDIVTYTDWNWDFGDGDTHIGRDTLHLYTTPDTFEITLFVCSITIIDSAFVYQTAASNAGSDETLCESFPYDFTNSAVQPSAVSYDSLLWYGGTGNFSDPRILMPVYTPGVGEEGAVELFMVAYGLLPCSNDTSSMILTLDSLPEPAFNFVPNDSICINEMISFTGTNNNTTSITNWDWDFGDGNFATDQNPFYAYVFNGVFDVQLTLTNAQGCVDSLTQQVTVNQLPDAGITIGPNDSICSQLPLSFVGTDYNGTTITDWDWDFGDGNLASGQNVVHTYMAPGSYTVTLYLTNDNSCLDTAYANVVVHTLPLSDFTIAPNDTVCINETVTFDGSDFSGTNITSWDWDFADGNSGTGQIATHIYSAAFPLVDSVRLIATNDNSCVDTAYQNIWVKDPTVGFNISPKPACLGDTITFTGTGDIVTYTDWNWDFGDGGTHIGRDTIHLYTTPDTFEITLSVCSITIIDSAFVYQTAASDAGSDESLCESFPYDFSNSTVQPSAISYDSLLWFGGGGNFNDSKILLPIYTPGFGEEGPIELFMVAYGLLPCSNDTSSMILTLDSLPEPAFNFVPTDSICLNEVINFSGINNNTTTITNWDWEFGDGNLSTIQNPTHAFGSDGFFDVQLTITNTQGCTDSVTTTLQVHPLPDPDFTIMPNDTICAELPLSFSGFDIAGTTVTDWSWDFGDGNLSTGQNVNHTYTAPGDYVVTLTALNDNSCTEFHTKTVHIHSLPESNFTISPNDSTCVDEIINLDASNLTTDITLWEWQFGDGNTAFGQNVNHTYTNPVTQTYNILSIYQNEVGCIDTTIHQRYVQNVSVGFSMVPSPSCQDYTVNFTGTNDRVTFTPWNWTFGDGSPSGTGLDVSHVYLTPDTVDVILNVCSQQEIHELIINAACEVHAGSNEITCQDVYFDLSESTTPPSADDFSSILWYSNGLGTIDDPTLLAPTYFPHPSEGSVQNDTITLTMVGIGISPCENDTSQMELIVIPGAYAQAGSDEYTCFGVPYNFINSTDSSFATNYVTLYWTTSGTGS